MIKIENLRIGQKVYVVYDSLTHFIPTYKEWKIIELSEYNIMAGENRRGSLYFHFHESEDEDIFYENGGASRAFLNKEDAVEYYNKRIFGIIEELKNHIIE